MKEIVIDYTESKLSIEKIAIKYKIGKIKVKNILRDNNISLNKKGNQKKIFEVQTNIDITHKFNFGKKNIKKKYPDVDLNKSEFQIMSELGYDKIWDCGLIKYQYIV